MPNATIYLTAAQAAYVKKRKIRLGPLVRSWLLNEMPQPKPERQQKKAAR